MKLKRKLLKSKIDYLEANKIKNNLYPLFTKIKNGVKLSQISSEKIGSIIKLPYNHDYDTLKNIVDSYPILKKHYSTYFSKFMSPVILSYLINETNQVNKYLLQYDNTRVYINILSKVKYDINKILIKGIKCIFLLESLNLKNISININFAPLNIKKIYKKGLELVPHNFNSGFTTVYYNMDMYGDINIFREEDSDKVFLHELIHCIKYDFGGSYDNSIDEYIRGGTKVSSDINLYESMTDIYAIVYDSILNSYFTEQNLNDILYTEIQYLNQLLNYIIIQTGFKSIKDVLLPKEYIEKTTVINNEVTTQKILKSKIWKQSTPVFTYYLLKLGGLINLDKYMTTYRLSKEPWKLEKQKRYYHELVNSLISIKLPLERKKLIINPSVRMVYNELIL